MPGSPGQIRIEEEIAARHEVETGTLLMGNNDGERVGELLAIDRIKQWRKQSASVPAPSNASGALTAFSRIGCNSSSSPTIEVH